MRKHRNARTHWTSKAAWRPDGMPNRAMLRSMSPMAQALAIRMAVGRWASTAAALVPGYVPPDKP